MPWGAPQLGEFFFCCRGPICSSSRGCSSKCLLPAADVEEPSSSKKGPRCCYCLPRRASSFYLMYRPAPLKCALTLNPKPSGSKGDLTEGQQQMLCCCCSRPTLEGLLVCPLEKQKLRCAVAAAAASAAAAAVYPATAAQAPAAAPACMNLLWFAVAAFREDLCDWQR